MNKKEQDSLAVILDAWKHAPHRLISLRDMIQFYTSKLHAVLEDLDYYKNESLRLIKENGGDGGEASDGLKDSLNLLIEKARALCKTFDLETSNSRGAAFYRRLLGMVDHPVCTHQIIVSQIEELEHSIWWELGEKSFTFIPPGKVQYFEKPALFDDQVNKHIPDALIDIKSAGNCLALDLNTAAVFHLMRVVEFGLRALAVSLDKTKIGERELKFTTWSEIIEAVSPVIERKLKALPKISTNQTEDEARARYRGLLTDFQYFKDSSRNPMFHSRKDYTAALAEEVYLQISEFMRRLAEVISGN